MISKHMIILIKTYFKTDKFYLKKQYSATGFDFSEHLKCKAHSKRRKIKSLDTWLFIHLLIYQFHIVLVIRRAIFSLFR
ncbi:hypothetical protein CAN34_06455 [Psychrobacter sp. DAB_AL32B]|nr:hypothetical protein CAN34_06455 [Psychrobacter sp. DAB_AL32B]